MPQALALAAAWVGALPAAALAQEAGQGFRLTPTFSAEESYLETRGRITGDNGREAVTRLAPGLRLSSRSGRVQGSLDYVGSLFYRVGRGETQGREFQNALNAGFLAEAVPNWAYLDARASISQQAVSAFDQQSVGGSLQNNGNRTEVSTLSLSPYVRGSLGGVAAYEARLNASATDSRDPDAVSSRTSGAVLSLRSSRAGALFGWALSASQQRTDFNGSDDRAVDSSRVDATVSVAPVPELRLSLSGGRESNDDGALADRRATNTTGVGLQWSPSQRTNLGVDLAERYFGRSSRVSFSHRTPRTVWSYGLTRDTNTGADGLVFGQPQTLFQLFDTQLQSAFPDPALREAEVLRLLAGRDPNQLVATGFLTSSYSLQRRQDLSFAWLGLRTTFGLQAFTTAQSQLVTIGSADPVAGEAVRQHGYSTSLSYRLTPETTVVLGGSRQMTFATSTQAGNDLKSAYANFSSQLGRRTSAQLGARYTVFNSTTDPYRETSVSASLNLRY